MSSRQLAADVAAALAAAEELQALSRTQPHLFHEQKDGLVRQLRSLYADVQGAPTAPPTRLPARESTFRTGAIVRRGRVIPVQRRSGR